MTIRPNYESLMPALLRTAPYIDIEELRVVMEGYTQLALESYAATSIYRAQMLEFISGEGHVLPMRYSLTDSLYLAMHEMMRLHQPEDMMPSAFDSFYKPYFFFADRSLGISQ